MQKTKNMKIKKIRQIDRKAWLRIVEAFLAVLIIMGAVLVILARQEPRSDISETVYERQRQILDIISKNNSLREEIITTSETENNLVVNGMIQNLIPGSWEFATNICSLDGICPNPGIYEDRAVFAAETIITSTLTEYRPKKLRFFVWMK